LSAIYRQKELSAWASLLAMDHHCFSLGGHPCLIWANLPPQPANTVMILRYAWSVCSLILEFSGCV